MKASLNKEAGGPPSRGQPHSACSSCLKPQSHMYRESSKPRLFMDGQSPTLCAEAVHSCQHGVPRYLACRLYSLTRLRRCHGRQRRSNLPSLPDVQDTLKILFRETHTGPDPGPEAERETYKVA